MEEHLKPGTVVDGQFEVIKSIHRGKMGLVFEVRSKLSAKKLAVKIHCPEKHDRPPLIMSEVCLLSKAEGTGKEFHHIAKFFHHGFLKQNDVLLPFIVTELLGPNLFDLFEKCQRKFSMSTALYLGAEMIAAVEEVHSLGYVHRDIKPTNFVVGLLSEHRRRLFIIDYDRVQRFVDVDSNLIPPINDGKQKGSTYYSPAKGHRGHDLTRADDLLMVFYILVELISGSLPWLSTKDVKEICTLKETFTPRRLIAEFQLPSACSAMLDQIENLPFTETPNYEKLKQLLLGAIGEYREVSPQLGFSQLLELDYEKYLL